MLPMVKHSCPQALAQTNAKLIIMGQSVINLAQQIARRLEDGSTDRESQVARRRMASASSAMMKSGGERRAKMRAPQVARMISAASQMDCAKAVARTASLETNVTRSAPAAARVVVATKRAANATMAATLAGGVTSVINLAQKGLAQRAAIAKLGSPKHVWRAAIRLRAFSKTDGFTRVAQTTAKPTNVTFMETALTGAKLDSTAVRACRVVALIALVLVTKLPLTKKMDTAQTVKQASQATSVI